MGARVKIDYKFNLKAYTAVRKSPAIQRELERRAMKIKTSGEAASGGTYSMYTREGNRRVGVMVGPADAKAKRDNQRNNTLLKSLGAAR